MEHPDIAASYNNIGVVYRHQGNYNKALEYLNKALDIRVKVLGLEHSKTAISYRNIGKIYEYQGAYTQALEYQNKALKIFEKILGKEHEQTKEIIEIITNLEKQIQK